MEDGGAWEDKNGAFDREDEQKVLYAALDSFSQYGKTAHFNTTHLRRQNFYALPQAHWQLLAAPPISYLDTLNAADDAIDKNEEISLAILEVGLQALGLPASLAQSEDGEKYPKDFRGFATPSDLEKARSTLRQLYRDWSAEGASERAKCYDPVIADLVTESERQGKMLKVLVPGAGLGRLCFELCRRGFETEGNEISYHQLLASSYMLNHCKRAQQHTLYPWIHGFSNHKSRENHLKAVQVPDVHPSSVMLETKWGEMSMSASDFLCLYSDEEHKSLYDAVATVFFIDTAPNIIRYIETIKHCLSSGGIWTNFGPLLWHFENNAPGGHGQSDAREDSASQVEGRGIADPGSFELTDDEVVQLVEKLGFVIEKRECGNIDAPYIQDHESMQHNAYRASHWVARKV